MIFWRYKLRKVWFFWIILFEFWLILFVSAAFFIILVEKFPIFLSFYSEWFCWSSICSFFKEWLSGPILLYASLASIFFSVGNFRHILILFWCQFFFVHLPFFFLSCRIYSKTLGIICGSLHLSLHYIFNAFIRIFEDLMLLSQVPFSRLFF